MIYLKKLLNNVSSKPSQQTNFIVKTIHFEFKIKGNQAYIYIFLFVVWLHPILGKVCLRQLNIDCEESMLIQPHTTHVCM